MQSRVKKKRKITVKAIEEEETKEEEEEDDEKWIKYVWKPIRETWQASLRNFNNQMAKIKYTWL